MQNASISDLHREHKQWLTDAEGWERELSFLGELIQKTKDKASGNSIEDRARNLENRLNHHRSLIREMVRDINSHERFIKDLMADNEVDIQSLDLTDHEKHRRHVSQFRQTLNELKQEVYQLAE